MQVVPNWILLGKWRNKVTSLLNLWKRKIIFIFKTPKPSFEEEAVSQIKLLGDIANMEEVVSPPTREEDIIYENEPERLLDIDKDKIFAEIQKRTPILLYLSGKRLERLTKWLIYLTAILSLLTLITLLAIFKII